MLPATTVSTTQVTWLRIDANEFSNDKIKINQTWFESDAWFDVNLMWTWGVPARSVEKARSRSKFQGIFHFDHKFHRFDDFDHFKNLRHHRDRDEHHHHHHLRRQRDRDRDRDDHQQHRDNHQDDHDDHDHHRDDQHSDRDH